MKLIGCPRRIFLRDDAKPCVFQFPNKTWGVFQTLVSVVGCVWFPPPHCLKVLEVWRWEGTEVLYNTGPIFSYKTRTRALTAWLLLVNHSKEPLCSSDSPAAGHSSTYVTCALPVGATWGPVGVNHQHFGILAVHTWRAVMPQVRKQKLKRGVLWHTHWAFFFLLLHKQPLRINK